MNSKPVNQSSSLMKLSYKKRIRAESAVIPPSGEAALSPKTWHWRSPITSPSPCTDASHWLIITHVWFHSESYWMNHSCLWHVHALPTLIHSNSYMSSNHGCWWGTNMAANLLDIRTSFMMSFVWNHCPQLYLSGPGGLGDHLLTFARNRHASFSSGCILTSPPTSIHPDYTGGPPWQLSPTVKLGLCFRHQDLNINLISLPMSLLLSSLGI